MPRATLQALAADVDRLLAAGAASAPGDAGLIARRARLRALGEKVPAMAAIADAVGLVVEDGPGGAARPLLNLLAIASQARAALATAGDGCEGSLEPITPSGPWESAASAERLYAAGGSLARSGSGRMDALMGDPIPADLRWLDTLLAALGDRYGELADWAANVALPAFGPSILPELRARLDFKGSAEHGRILAAICAIDPAAAGETCLRALREGGASVRLAAFVSLPAVAPELVESEALAVLRGKAPEAIRVAAIKALGCVRPATEETIAALSAWVKASKYDYHVAIDILKRIGEPAVGAVAGLLQDPDEAVRMRATWILNGMGPAAAAAVPALIEALEDRGQWIRRNALWALGAIGPGALAAIPEVMKAQDDPEREHRVAAAHAASRIAGPTPRAIRVLREAIREGDSNSVREAAQALAEIGPAAADAVPDLTAKLNNPSAASRHFAAEALAAIGPAAEGAIPGLIAALSDGRYFVRNAAARALAKFGTPASSAIPVLESLLSATTSKDERAGLAEALAALRMASVRP